MTEILTRAMVIAQRIQAMDVQGMAGMVLFGVLLVFGIVNCILGYRLLRFWMMIFGFIIGASLGLVGAYQMGVQDKMIYIGALAAAGILLAAVAFFSYRAGIFILGAGLGLTLALYILHPTTSFAFFICILAGVGLGILAMRYEREVIIVGTSLLGGLLAGFSLAKLGGLAEVPYGIGLSAGFALLGLLIQFALNKTRYEEDEYEEEEPGPSPVQRNKNAYREETSSGRYREKSTGNARSGSYRANDTADLRGSTDSGPADERSAQDQGRTDPGYDEYNYEEYGGERGSDYDLDYEMDEEEAIEEYLEDYYGGSKKSKAGKGPDIPIDFKKGSRSRKDRTPSGKGSGGKQPSRRR